MDNKTKIKIKTFELFNIKNVERGKFHTNVDFDNFNKANITGFYGQNGSGKTAIVSAFKILETLIDSESLKVVEKNLINTNSDNLGFDITFKIELTNREQFFLKYKVKIGDNEGYYVKEEVLEYRENLKGKKFKKLISANLESLTIRNESIKVMSEALRIKSLVSFELSKKERKSFIFNEELKPVLKEKLNDREFQLFLSIGEDFRQGLHIIENIDYGLMMANILIPFNIYQDELKGTVALRETLYSNDSSVSRRDPFAISKELYKLLKDKVFPSINVVLPNIIPGLTIDIVQTAEVYRDDGEKGVNYQLLSIRNGNKMPLSSESEGIIKIVSMLSVLSAIFKETNACVVIDELDSGIFEYLLGELLKVAEESAKGQLVFTSHNLRVIELISIKSIWFTTTNPRNRYIQLKYTSNTSNNRDVYIRALQIKNQDEELYEKTDNFKIKKAFKKLAFQGKDYE